MEVDHRKDSSIREQYDLGRNRFGILTRLSGLVGCQARLAPKKACIPKSPYNLIFSTLVRLFEPKLVNRGHSFIIRQEIRKGVAESDHHEHPVQ